MSDQPWHKTVCILCECNCGIEIRLEDRQFTRIRGDKEHKASRGYTCEKALRLNHYQNGRHRLTSPMRRTADGTYEEVDWETAITEVAVRLKAVQETHGGETIFYYGGGGQGNHLCGVYGTATRAAVGSRYRSSALAQEKTGEFWVNAHIGASTRGDFANTEVAVFIGKNPWQSHGIPHARRTLKEIANDPERSMIVLDPRRTETADLADLHLQVKPGTDVYALAAMVKVLFEEDLIDERFVAANVTGFDELRTAIAEVDFDRYATNCGIDPQLLRSAARRIGQASTVAIFEDLGVQMAPNSTLNSYLEKLLWILTGNFAKEGTMITPVMMVPFATAKAGSTRKSPVVGARIISGLVPCNVVPEEILSDAPGAYKAMIIESSNPVHSLADSPRWREAMAALEFSVVIDVAMTETARHADIVLPAASQFEKWEASFFNFEFPDNVFTLRAPLLEPLPGTLPEPEIHYRLCRELGVLDQELLERLRETAQRNRLEFAGEFYAAISGDPLLGRLAPVILYATLGPALPGDAAQAAAMWGICHQAAMRDPKAISNSGIEGEGPLLGEALFDEVLASRTGVVFSRSEPEESWDRVTTMDGKLNVAIPEMLDLLAAVPNEPIEFTSDEYPLILAAGERRSFTANTIIRDPEWRKRDQSGALRISPADATTLGIVAGSNVRVITPGGAVVTAVEISDTVQPGHITLPNGLGVDYPDADGEAALTGVSTNELTYLGHQDPLAGTPWHKHVPARVEVVV
ncbi:MAG: molybdopterin-dependent oxidoreductase [Acidimicrobiia bacterium]|nr:molybdopterin-dependent oxidoreductase [Acidimicrobiia bacterium]